MSLWMIIHKGSQWRTGDLFRDAGSGEVEKIHPIKDEQGKIVGENPSGIYLDAMSVKPWAVNMDSGAGMRTANPFRYNPATGNADMKPVDLRPVEDADVITDDWWEWYNSED